MILKKALSKCIVLKESELTKEIILKNDIYKICTGCVEQYVVTEDGRLYGMISSFDIEREIAKSGDFELDSVINKQPLAILRSDRFERDFAEQIFSKTYRIYSIPVVDAMGRIQYIYSKINSVIQGFAEQNWKRNAIQWQKNIKNEIMYWGKLYPEKKVYILSDFDKYAIEQEEIKGLCICEDEIDSLDKDKSFILCVYMYDFNCMAVMSKLIKSGIKWAGSNYTGRDVVAEVTPYFRMDEAAKDVLEEEAFFNGNYFDLNDFENIFQAIHMTRNVDGCYVEIGTYRGDSARAALSYMKKSGIKRKTYFLDTYEGFTYVEAEGSTDCSWANSHDDTSIDFVENRLQEFPSHKLIKNNIITDVFPEEIGQIAVCNIDVDMYEAVAAALEKVYPKVAAGGVIIAEDFGHTPALFGAQHAVREFMSLHKDEFHGIYMKSGQYLLIKK